MFVPLLLAHIALLASLGALTHHVARARPTLAPWLALPWATLMVGLGLAAALDPAQVLPADIVTVLKEGTTYVNLKILEHQGIHADAVVAEFWRPLFPRATGARHLVRVNLLLFTVAAALSATLARAVLGRWGPLLTLGWVASPMFASGATSIGAAGAAAVYALTLAIGLHHTRAPHASATSRAAGWVTLGLSAALLAGTRAELGAFGLGAVAAAGLHGRLPRGWARRWHRAFLAAPWPGAVAALTWLGLIANAGPWWFPRFVGVGDFEVRTIRAALNPLPVHLPLWPEWATLGLPPVLGALAVAGMARGLIHPLRTAFALPALIFLASAYATSAHTGPAVFGVLGTATAPYEIYRYLGYVQAELWLLALSALAALSSGAAGSWGARAAPWLAALTLTPTWPWLAEQRHHGWTERPDGASHAGTLTYPRWGRLSRDQQEEARWLEALYAETECDLLTLSFPEFFRGDRTLPGYTRMTHHGEGMVFEGPITREDGSPRPARELLAATPRCARFFWSLDCNLVEVDCAPLVEGLELLEAREAPSAPTLHPEHTYVHRPVRRLAVYALPADAP